jgi:hypothetical protein
LTGDSQLGSGRQETHNRQIDAVSR